MTSSPTAARPRRRIRCLVGGIRVFSVKLVLEVFGGGGAIWGFSEAVGLRNSDTRTQWQWGALTVATLFLIRWLLQIRRYSMDFIRERRRMRPSNSDCSTTVIERDSLVEHDHDDNGSYGSNGPTTDAGSWV